MQHSFITTREVGIQSPSKTTGEIALEGVLRAIDVHERMLESLRTRTGPVIAGSSISASFLGSAVLGQQDQSCVGLALSYLGVVAFAGSLITALLVVWPRTDRWLLEVSPTAILGFANEEGVLSDAALQEMAVRTERQLDSLKESMKPLWNLFRASIILLGIQVVLWLVALALEAGD